MTLPLELVYIRRTSCNQDIRLTLLGVTREEGCPHIVIKSPSLLQGETFISFHDLHYWLSGKLSSKTWKYSETNCDVYNNFIVTTENCDLRHFLSCTNIQAVLSDLPSVERRYTRCPISLGKKTNISFVKGEKDVRLFIRGNNCIAFDAIRMIQRQIHSRELDKKNDYLKATCRCPMTSEELYVAEAMKTYQKDIIFHKKRKRDTKELRSSIEEQWNHSNGKLEIQYKFLSEKKVYESQDPIDLLKNIHEWWKLVDILKIQTPSVVLPPKKTPMVENWKQSYWRRLHMWLESCPWKNKTYFVDNLKMHFTKYVTLQKNKLER